MKLAEPAKKPVYLDVCALCRSFDDQQYMRIRLETAAVELIIEHIRFGNYELYYSSTHLFEIEEIEDSYERGELQDLMRSWGVDAKKKVSLKETRQRAEELVQKGFGFADAAHVAFAEALKAPFITCDDKLIKRCRRYSISVWCGTPVEFCEQENIK